MPSAPETQEPELGGEAGGGAEPTARPKAPLVCAWASSLPSAHTLLGLCFLLTAPPASQLELRTPVQASGAMEGNFSSPVSVWRRVR